MLVTQRAIANYFQGVTVGLPLMVGLLIAFAPAEVFLHFPAILRPIIANGFVMGTLLVILLDRLPLRPSPGPKPGSDNGPGRQIPASDPDNGPAPPDNG
jgi:xanthine/uracil permease